LNVTNTAMTISMQAGDLLIYTNKAIVNGINDIKTQNSTTIFPTETVDKVYISSPATIKSASIYSLDGSLQKTVSNSTEIDVQNLIKGVYIMEVNTTDGKSLYKIIKQ